MVEIWRDVVGYEGLYMVSNHGKVYSIRNDCLLRQTLGKRGYYTVSLFRDNTRKEMTVHRIVAFAFINNPNNLPCINHKDECKTNNIVSNLEWCTRAYNNNYGTARERGKKKIQKKISQYTTDGIFLKEWRSIKEASLETGINGSNICQCCRLNPRHSIVGGFIWRYSEGA